MSRQTASVSGPSIVIFADDPLDGLASRVSMALGIALHARESSHYGEPYYSAWPESELNLTDNLDPMYRPGDPPDDRYFIPEMKDAQFVLWNADPVDQSVARLQEAGIDARAIS